MGLAREFLRDLLRSLDQSVAVVLANDGALPAKR
jgi:hypothetical protein